MMQRRTLIKSATAAATLGLPGLGALAQQAVTLKFHTFMAPTSNVYLNAHKAWMNKVEKDAGGRIKFEGYPAMQLGGSPGQLYDQARDGVVDIVWTLAGLTPGRFPRTEVFELPFMTVDAIGASRAAWAYRRPASVSCIRLVVRSNRRMPCSSSSAAMALATAEGVLPSCSAARLKLFCSTTHTRVVSALNLSTIDSQQEQKLCPKLAFRCLTNLLSLAASLIKTRESP